MRSATKSALTLKLLIVALLLLSSVLHGCTGQEKQQAGNNQSATAESNWEKVRATGEGVIYEGSDINGGITIAYLKKNTCYYENEIGRHVVTIGDTTFESMGTDASGRTTWSVWGPVDAVGCNVGPKLSYLGPSQTMPRSSIQYAMADAIFKFYRKGPYRVSTYGAR